MSKQVTYTEDQTVQLVAAYKDAETDAERKDVVETFATAFGKTPNSIRAKLSREGVYQKPAKVTKSGKAIVKKAELVEQIADKLGVSSEVVESLEKATKVALEKVLAHLA